MCNLVLTSEAYHTVESCRRLSSFARLFVCVQVWKGISSRAWYPVEIGCVQVWRGHPLLKNIVNILLNLLLHSRKNLQQNSKAPEELHSNSYLPEAKKYCWIMLSSASWRLFENIPPKMRLLRYSNNYRNVLLLTGSSFACPRPNCIRPPRCVASSDCCNRTSISSATGAYTEQV